MTLCPSGCFGPGYVLYTPYSSDGVYVVEAWFSMLRQNRANHLGVVGPLSKNYRAVWGPAMVLSVKE